MSRAIADRVHVRVSAEPAAAGGDRPAPEQFIWRNRLYVVHRVLGRWRQRQPWWAHPSARAAAGGGVTTVAELSHCADREIWRVEAADGRRAPGIFDLAADPLVDGGTDWQLVQVVD